MANKNVSQERMKAKTLFLLLLAMALMSGGVARQRVFSVSGRVIDTSGKGVKRGRAELTHNCAYINCRDVASLR